MDGLTPIETYILRRDYYYKSYPPLPEHPYNCKVHSAQPILAHIHGIIASSKLVENTLYDLNIKFLECHCFARTQLDGNPQFRYPVISIFASGHPDQFASAAKLIWKKLARLRTDEFMQKLVVEIYDRALMTSRERFDISESVAAGAGLSPLPPALQDLRKQVNGWFQFTPCLMYAHCSTSTEDDAPIPTLLIRCFHNKTADYASLEDDILHLLPKVQVIFEAIPPLPNDEADARSEREIANRLDSDLWALRQRSHHSFARYLGNMFIHPAFSSLSGEQQSFHILDKMTDRYHDFVFANMPDVPGLPPPTLEALIYLGTEMDAKLKHPGETESMSYSLFFAERRQHLLEMVVKANTLAAAEKAEEEQQQPKAVDLGLVFNKDMIWLDYHTRHRTPAIEMRHDRQLHRLQKATAVALDTSTSNLEEAWKQTRHPRAYPPSSLSPRQWAIPSSCTVLGSCERAFSLDLAAVTEQQEEDSWSDVDPVEAAGQVEPEKSKLDEIVDMVRGSVWFDTARKTAGRVALGKEWRKW